FGQNLVTNNVDATYRSMDLSKCPGTECGWTLELTNTDLARHSHAVALDYMDEGYIVGGWADKILNDIIKVLPLDEEMEQDADMEVMNSSFDGGPPTGLTGTAFATSGEAIYAFGGKLGDGDVLNTLYAFNTTATCEDACAASWADGGQADCVDACDQDWDQCDTCEQLYEMCMSYQWAGLCEYVCPGIDASLISTCNALYCDADSCEEPGYADCIGSVPTQTECEATQTTCTASCNAPHDCDAICADIWTAPEPEYWTLPTITGSVPTARFDGMMAAFGPLLMVFGGQDNDGVFLDDEFTYHTEIQEVQEQASTGTKPSARSASAITTVGETMVLFGGMGTDGVLGDTYVFSYFDKKWAKLTHATGSARPKLSHASLFFIPTSETQPGTYSLSDGMVFLQGGVGENMMCESTLYQLEIDMVTETVAFKKIVQVDSENYVSSIDTAFANAPFSVLGQRAVSTGGRSNMMSSPAGVVRVFDFTSAATGTVVVSEILPKASSMQRSRMSAIQGVIDTTFVSIGGYLVQSAMEPEGQAVSEVWAATLGEPCNPEDGSADPTSENFDPTCFSCVKGTYYDSDYGSCFACPTGRFSAHDGMSECTACPAGFYNGVQHGDSRLFCLACPSGTYNGDEGAAQCLPCPDGYTCPVACAVPVLSTTQSNIPVTDSPKELVVDKDFVKKVQKYIYYILGFIVASAFLAIVLYKHSILLGLDRFPIQWIEETPSELGEKKTWIGGVLSGVFWCFFVVMGCGLVVPFLFTNIAEDRSLVPLSLASTDLTGTLTIDLALTGGFESCVVPGVDGTNGCAEAIQITLPSPLLPANVTQTCTKPSSDNSQCTVHLEVPKAQLESRETEFAFTLDGDAGEYFASVVEWTVTSDASNPKVSELSTWGEFLALVMSEIEKWDKFHWFTGNDEEAKRELQTSSITGTLLPEPSMTFRGITEPTEISIFSTESMYLLDYEPSGEEASELNPNPSTGRIFEFIKYEKGSMVNSQNFWDQNGVSLSILIERSENVLSWKQTKVQDMAAFFAAILGAMTGLHGTFEGIVGFLRGQWDGHNDRKEAKKAKRDAIVASASSRLARPTAYDNPLLTVPRGNAPGGVRGSLPFAPVRERSGDLTAV
ncbi:hypothetical protein KIPB_002054, partial [Kipferlia bialata]